MKSSFLKLAVLTLVVGSAALMTACKENDEQTQNIATVPYSPNASCMSNNSYNPNLWSPYSGSGYLPYPGYAGYSNGYGGFYGQSGICGCPTGTIPVCDNYAGLGCAPDPRGYGYSYPYYNWQQQQSNGYGFQYQGYGYLNQYNSCYTGVAQTCRLGTNDCGYGRCYPAGNNANIGICVQ